MCWQWQRGFWVRVVAGNDVDVNADVGILVTEDLEVQMDGPERCIDRLGDRAHVNPEASLLLGRIDCGSPT